jgi:hypothetical protein
MAGYHPLRAALRDHSAIGLNSTLKRWDAKHVISKTGKMHAIPLCVPFARKDEARRAGARWNKEGRVWTCDPALLATSSYARLRPFVPRMYRPDVVPPFIRPWMVPQTLWGKNLRALLPKEQWDVVRRHAYEAAGNRCRVCGGRGPQWPVEADEAWDYDDETRTQTLKGVIALCPDCHHIRHWGKTSVDGNEEEALQRLMMINGWSREVAEQAVEVAFEQWDRRSRHDWQSDYSWVTRVHGFQIDEGGMLRAEAANRDLVAEAISRVDALEWLTTPSTSIDEMLVGSPRTERPIQAPQPTSRRTLLGFLRSLID